METGKEFIRLWFEALRMSDEYRQLCEKVNKHGGPFETMDKDDFHADTIKTFEKFDNVLNYNDFDDWWESHGKLEGTLDQIIAGIEIDEINLPDFLSTLMEHVEKEFEKNHKRKPNYNEFKEMFLQYLSDSYQVEQLMFFEVDISLGSTSEDIGDRIAKLISKRRKSFSSLPEKRLSEKIALYLDVYKQKNKMKRTPKAIAEELDITARSVHRYIQKAKRIIENATRFNFPGKY